MNDKNNWPIILLAYLITVGFFGCLLMMMFFDIQPGVRDPIMIMIGFLGGSFSAVVGFYFGSSQSSQAKDGMLGRTNNCAGKCSP